MMQNRYTGEFDDFVKYGLLRHLSKGKSLGVAWYLYPDEVNTDGQKIGFLDAPWIWRHLDAELFDGLKGIVRGGRRCVAAVESSGLLPGAVFASECLDTDIPPSAWKRRREWRDAWFRDVIAKLSGCDIVFVDPDNGLRPDKNYSASRPKDWKQLPLSEARQLAKGRTAIFYHYNTRRAGGHRKEIEDWMDKLPGRTGAFSGAFYCNKNGCRTFVVVTHDATIMDRLAEFAKTWKQAGELILP